MKKIRSAALAAIAATLPMWATAADVGVSVSIGDPNFYGHIDIGNYHPDLIYPQPVIIERVPVRRAPLYLRVPPGHEKHWEKNCHKYDACGRPVYFVRDNWYRDVYAPAYRREHGHDHDHDHHDHDDDHGKGKGHGKGHDKH